MQAGHGEQMGKPRLLHGHGVALRKLRPVAGKLRRQEAPHRRVVPDGGDPLPQGMDGPQRQPLHTAPAAVVHGGVLPLVQQSVHATGGELRQLRAPDAGGILPPCRAGQLLARLQRQHLPAAVVHSPGAEEAVKAYRDPAAPLRLLRPRADRGGKVVFRAAPRLHRLLHRRLIDGEIHQRRRQRPQYQLAAPEVPPLLRPQAQAQRRQADANRRPEVPAAPRQQQDKEQSRGEGESGSGQYAHTLSPPRR